MKNKVAIILSIISVLLPIVLVAVYLNIESEFEEAVAAGIIVGCSIGSVTGITALIMNRVRKNAFVTVLSMLPIIPTIIFLMLCVTYHGFG